jgi:outer membrane protein insertion porin family
VGPIVKVTVNAEREKIGDKKQTELLPIKREGTVDFAAIIEGERRLENYYQEQGYFFADVTSVCSVDPQFTEEEASVTGNETEALCSALGGAELVNRTVEVKYNVDLNRQLKLVDIRIEGTDQLTIDEIRTVLESQKANALGFIPLFGYGRGYTSAKILEDDRATIRSLMRELGYRNAQVSVRQGVSPNGEDLIITFVIDEGAPTRIGDIDIEGNTAFSDAELKTQLPDLAGKNFSRARARNGVRKLSEFYSKAGYYDAKVSFALVEQPKDAAAQQETVKVVYKIDNEGRKVFIKRVLINGEEMTKPEAILKAINLRPDTVLRATDIFTSEQNLYATSAFRRVEIKVEPAGESADGNRLTDIIVNLEEEQPRLLTYGGGYSTDGGPFGFFDIRHYNLFGNLQQGGARLRLGRLQQTAQIDFINPRFMNDGRTEDGVVRYSPLTFSASYQRDSTVTRFFRSTFDRGTSASFSASMRKAIRSTSSGWKPKTRRLIA